MTPANLIAVAGKPAAGKSAVARMIADEAGMEIVSVADLLRGYLAAGGEQVQTRAEIGPTFLSRHSADSLYELIAAASREPSGAVIDSLRLCRTALQLQRECGASIWYVESPERARVERLTRRLRRESPSEQQFLFDRYELYNAEQESIHGHADVVLCNDTTLLSLRQHVVGALSEAGHVTMRTYSP